MLFTTALKIQNLRLFAHLAFAEYYNFDVANLKNKIREVALNTNSIGDITIYD